jgi:hypothetical protein
MRVGTRINSRYFLVSLKSQKMSGETKMFKKPVVIGLFLPYTVRRFSR